VPRRPIAPDRLGPPRRRRAQWIASALAALGAVAFPSASRAQLAVDGGAAVEPTPTELILEHERNTAMHTIGINRIRASYPQGLSAAVGLMRARQPVDYDCTIGCEHRGLVLQLEPGLHGIQVGAGYGLVIGDKRTNRTFLHAYHVGFGIKGVALRTWGDAPDSVLDQTYVGAEGDLSIASVSFSLGVLHVVSPDPGAREWLVSGGLGWGF